MDYKYDAFISYKRSSDSLLAEKLHGYLEHYKPHKDVVYKISPKIKKVYLDVHEAGAGNKLTDAIRQDLEKSRFIIAVISEETQKSELCKDEVRYFKDINGGLEKIIVVLTGGEPEKVIFPEIAGIRYLDVRAESEKQSIKLLKREILKIISTLMGCDYDDLFRRHHRRILKNVISASTVFVTTVTFVVIALLYFANETRNANASLYYKIGTESTEKFNNAHLGMRYLADSLSLRYANAPALSLALLLQDYSWASINFETQGRLIDGFAVLKRPLSEHLNKDDLPQAENIIFVDDDFDFDSLLAVDETGSEFLTALGWGNYSVPVTIAEEDIYFDKNASIGNCWVFIGRQSYYIYDIAKREVYSLPFLESFADQNVKVYDNGSKAVMAGEGKLNFYELSGSKEFICVYSMDLPKLFPVYNPPPEIDSSILSLTDNMANIYSSAIMFIDKAENLLVVSSANTFCVINLVKKEKIFADEVIKNFFIINAAFSEDGSKIAVIFSNPIFDRTVRSDGIINVYSLKGRQIASEQGSMKEAVFSGDSEKLLIMDADKTVKIFQFNGTEGMSEFCKPIMLTEKIKKVMFGGKNYALATEDSLGNVQFYSFLVPSDNLVKDIEENGYPILLTVETQESELGVLTNRSLTYVNVAGGETINRYGIDTQEYAEFLKDYSRLVPKSIISKQGDEYGWLMDKLASSVIGEMSSSGRQYNSYGSVIAGSFISTDNSRIFTVGSSIPYFAEYEIDYENKAINKVSFVWINDFIPTGIWQSRNGEKIMISTYEGEILIYNAESIFTGNPIKIKFSNLGKVDEVQMDESGKFLAASISRSIGDGGMLTYGTLELWDTSSNNLIKSFSDQKSYINGLCFTKDYLFYGVNGRLHKNWMPTERMSAERINFFKNLSGYELDKQQNAVIVPVLEQEITKTGIDEWSKLYSITNDINSIKR